MSSANCKPTTIAIWVEEMPDLGSELEPSTWQGNIQNKKPKPKQQELRHEHDDDGNGDDEYYGDDDDDDKSAKQIGAWF